MTSETHPRTPSWEQSVRPLEMQGSPIQAVLRVYLDTSSELAQVEMELWEPTSEDLLAQWSRDRLVLPELGLVLADYCVRLMEIFEPPFG